MKVGVFIIFKVRVLINSKVGVAINQIEVRVSINVTV